MGTIVTWFFYLIIGMVALVVLGHFAEKKAKKSEEEKPKEKSRPTVFKNKGHAKNSTRTNSDDILWKGSKSINIEYMSGGNFKVIDLEITSIWSDERGDMYFEGYGQTFNVDGVMRLKNAKGRKFEDFYDYMEKDLKI